MNKSLTLCVLLASSRTAFIVSLDAGDRTIAADEPRRAPATWNANSLSLPETARKLIGAGVRDFQNTNAPANPEQPRQNR